MDEPIPLKAEDVLQLHNEVLKFRNRLEVTKIYTYRDRAEAIEAAERFSDALWDLYINGY